MAGLFALYFALFVLVEYLVAPLIRHCGGPEAATAPEDTPSASAGRSRWRLAGLLGHPPREMEPEDSLWAYTRWEDIP